MSSSILWRDVLKPVYAARFDGAALAVDSLGDFARRVRLAEP